MSHNKIAIFLRGYQRTWNFTKQLTFDTFEQIYGCENIDWYVAFWNSNSTNIDSIKADFTGKNLISCQLIDNNNYPLPRYMLDLTLPRDFSNKLPYYARWKSYVIAYWRPAYLDLILSREKIKHEIATNVEYKQVLFIRPDVAYVCNDIIDESQFIDEFSIGGAELYVSKDHEIPSQDLYYKTSTITADIIASRFLDTFTQFTNKQLVHMSPHSLFGWFLLRNGITEPKYYKSQMVSLIIRPNMVNYIPTKDVDLIHEEHRCTAWTFLTVEQQIEMCDRCQIDPIEYFNL